MGIRHDYQPLMHCGVAEDHRFALAEADQRHPRQ